MPLQQQRTVVRPMRTVLQLIMEAIGPFSDLPVFFFFSYVRSCVPVGRVPGRCFQHTVRGSPFFRLSPPKKFKFVIQKMTKKTVTQVTAVVT